MNAGLTIRNVTRLHDDNDDDVDAGQDVRCAGCGQYYECVWTLSNRPRLSDLTQFFEYIVKHRQLATKDFTHICERVVSV